MSGSRGDRIEWEWLLVGVLLVAIAAFVVAKVISRLGWEKAEEPVLARVLEAGRLTEPIPELRIDEPAGALVVYIIPGGDMYESLASLDRQANALIEPGDLWVYYFDTLEEGPLWLIVRCEVQGGKAQVARETCQWSQFVGGFPGRSYLHEQGFVPSP